MLNEAAVGITCGLLQGSKFSFRLSHYPKTMISNVAILGLSGFFFYSTSFLSPSDRMVHIHNRNGNNREKYEES